VGRNRDEAVRRQKQMNTLGCQIIHTEWKYLSNRRRGRRKKKTYAQ
jgi:hypothetical protein